MRYVSLTLALLASGCSEPATSSLAAKHMATQAKIIGIHPVRAAEPVHLIVLLIEGDFEGFDFGKVTQETEGQPKANWQVAWDERLLEKAEGKARYAFFFHYLNLEKPLLTPAGTLQLPRPTRVPPHLQDIKYESP